LPFNAAHTDSPRQQIGGFIKIYLHAREGGYIIFFAHSNAAKLAWRWCSMSMASFGFPFPNVEEIFAPH
jgi:hypothetical protein